MQIEKFLNKNFGELDVFQDENGNSWFSGNQVAEALGYEAPRNAINKFVDESDRKTLNIKACTESVQAILWSRQNDYSNKTIINEYGMYSLVMRSYAPKAKDFQHWVTHEVLPSIRKNGGYIDGQEDLSAEDQAKVSDQIRALSDEVAQLNKKVAKLSEQADKVPFLQKRRHEILADNRKKGAVVKHLKIEQKALRKDGDHAYEMYDSLLDEYLDYRDTTKAEIDALKEQLGLPVAKKPNAPDEHHDIITVVDKFGNVISIAIQ